MNHFCILNPLARSPDTTGSEASGAPGEKAGAQALEGRAALASLVSKSSRVSKRLASLPFFAYFPFTNLQRCSLRTGEAGEKRATSVSC